LGNRLQQADLRGHERSKKKRDERLEFQIREISSDSWRYFSKYHYLSEKLPGGRTSFYGLFEGDNQIGFQCFANYTPKKKGMNWIYHSNRTVIHPDYAGFGLGIRVIDMTSALMKLKEPDCQIMARFSSIPVYKSMSKSDSWKLKNVIRKMNKEKPGGTMDRKSGFRDKGVTSFSFEFIGDPDTVLGRKVNDG